MINSYEPSAALAVRPTSSPLAFVATTTAPATGRGAHCGSGGDFSTGQTGPAEIVPISLGGPPAGDVNGVALGAPVPQAVTATAIRAMASKRSIRTIAGLVQARDGSRSRTISSQYRESVTWQPMSLAIETERLTLRLRDERDAAWYRELVAERGEDMPTLEEATTRLAQLPGSHDRDRHRRARHLSSR